MPSRKRRPPATRRSALELLAASPDGCTEAILIGLAPAGDRAHSGALKGLRQSRTLPNGDQLLAHPFETSAPHSFSP
jgi:hypothetical protein